MSENRKCLHEIIDRIENEDIVEYFITFITLYVTKFGRWKKNM